METKLKFRPIHFNWVAIHPQPIGIIHFIGGAFFGTFPTIFYRYIIRRLFAQGYTIAALPFRFTFRHWIVAISLVRDQKELREAITTEAKRLGYEYKIYQQKPISENPNHFWLAHSVGCKYIALLELLTELEEQDIQEFLGECVGSQQAVDIERSLRGVDFQDISLKNQPSVLLAPVIAGIERAIPVVAVAELVKKLGLDVQPNVKETRCLINKSHLFGLTAAITFGADKIASNPEIDVDGEPKGTIQWLQKHVASIKFSELPRREHPAPLGFRFGDSQLADEVIKLLKMETQQLESISTQPEP
ncbi:MAG: DUF1350 domain-containing protein [Cyanobacteria bacterium J083]|nr:MAG: DUF1350 domain-containing protein [Cyanobacteria bacterium J083]